MARGNHNNSLYLLTLLNFGILLFQCSFLSPRKPVDTLPQPINPGDKLPIEKIVRIHKDGFREIYATSPEAMRYIFYRAGCKDGSGLMGLLHHEWNDHSKIEKWTGACRSMKSDSIFFRISHPGDPIKYKEFGSITMDYLRKAENDKNVELFYRALEREPALADARLNLFHSYLESGKCSLAKRNMEIFLKLSPGFSHNSVMKSLYKKKCK